VKPAAAFLFVEKAHTRRSHRHAVLAAGTLAIALTVNGTDAALLPSMSEELRGRPLSSFESQTLDGQPFSSRDLVGKPVIVNFFASWCPVCSMELKDLQALQPDLRQRGVSVIEVLVDPVETPDTVDEARQQLAHNPLPFPVVMMVPALRDVFGYEGFPATYFLKADGTFSTTLFGYQPIEQLRQVAGEIAGATAPPSSPGPARGVGRHPPWEKRPLLALVPAPWAQWHPLLVHFPIALLVLEGAFVCALLVRPNERLAQFATWLLAVAVVSLVPTVLTGIRDAGADVGPGSPFWNGLHDRLTHLFRLESSVSLHVLFGLGVTLIAVGRLAWRVWAGDRILRGGHRVAFALVTLLGLWLLFGGGQVGGGISHR
jgi:thiol-disulfide isomerase/thioredoxin/uncharacterized membrane protein